MTKHRLKVNLSNGDYYVQHCQNVKKAVRYLMAKKRTEPYEDYNGNRWDAKITSIVKIKGAHLNPSYHGAVYPIKLQ